MTKKQNKNTYIIYITSFLLLFIVFGIIFIMQKNKTKNLEGKVDLNSGEVSIDLELETLYNKGEYKSIIDNYEKKGIKNLSDYEKGTLARTYLAYGNSFYKEEENAKKALEILNTLEESFDTIYDKGYAYEISENYTGAIDIYNKGLKKENITNNWKSIFLNQIGHVYELSGDYEKAYKYYKDSNNANPEFKGSLINLGRYFSKNKDFKKALIYFEKSIDKVDNVFIKAGVLFNLSSIYFYLDGEKLDNYNKSINYAQKAVDIAPNHPYGYIGVARILVYTGKIKDAELYLNKALELNPELTIAYKLYGTMKLFLGEYKESLKYFKKAEISSDKDITLTIPERLGEKGDIYYSMSILYSKMKNKEKTNEYLKKALGYQNPLVILKLKNQIDKEDYGDFKILKGSKDFEEIVKIIKEKI